MRFTSLSLTSPRFTNPRFTRPVHSSPVQSVHEIQYAFGPENGTLVISSAKKIIFSSTRTASKENSIMKRLDAGDHIPWVPEFFLARSVINFWPKADREPRAAKPREKPLVRSATISLCSAASSPQEKSGRVQLRK